MPSGTLNSACECEYLQYSSPILHISRVATKGTSLVTQRFSSPRTPRSLFCDIGPSKLHQSIILGPNLLADSQHSFPALSGRAMNNVHVGYEVSLTTHRASRLLCRTSQLKMKVAAVIVLLCIALALPAAYGQACSDGLIRVRCDLL